MNPNLAFWLTLFLWSIIPIIDKLALTGKKIDTIVGIFIRVLTVGIVFLVYLLFSSDFREKVYNHPWKNLILFSLSGFISLFFAQYCYYSAIKDSYVSKIFPVLFTATPILTVILSFIILKEKITYNMILGSILIAIGSFLMLKE